MEIGGVEFDGIEPTPEYDENVCIATAEFSCFSGAEYLDYDALSWRLSKLLAEKGVDGKYVLDYERWLPKVEEKPPSKKGKSTW